MDDSNLTPSLPKGNRRSFWEPCWCPVNAPCVGRPPHRRRQETTRQAATREAAAGGAQPSRRPLDPVSFQHAAGRVSLHARARRFECARLGPWARCSGTGSTSNRCDCRNAALSLRQAGSEEKPTARRPPVSYPCASASAFHPVPLGGPLFAPRLDLGCLCFRPVFAPLALSPHPCLSRSMPSLIRREWDGFLHRSASCFRSSRPFSLLSSLLNFSTFSWPQPVSGPSPCRTLSFSLALTQAVLTSCSGSSAP